MALTITSVTPASGATDVERNLAIDVLFSTYVNISTVSISSFTLLDYAGVSVPFTVELLTDQKTVRLTTTSLADAGRTYTAWVFEGDLGIHAVGEDDDTLTNDYTWSFTIGTTIGDDPGDPEPGYYVPDVEDLAVTTTSPDDDEVHAIPTAGAVVVTFDDDLASDLDDDDFSSYVTITGTDVVNNRARTEPNNGWLAVKSSTNSKQLLITAKATDDEDDTDPDFLTNTEYTITLDSTLPGDEDDQTLGSDYTFSFISYYAPHFIPLTSLQLDLGPMSKYITNHTAHMLIMRNSWKAWVLWTIGGSNGSIAYPIPECIEKYVRLKSKLDAISGIYVDQLTNGGMIKLADLEVDGASNSPYMLDDRRDLTKKTDLLEGRIRSGCRMSLPRGVIKGGSAMAGRLHPLLRSEHNRMMSRADFEDLDEDSSWGQALSEVSTSYAAARASVSASIYLGAGYQLTGYTEEEDE